MTKEQEITRQSDYQCNFLRYQDIRWWCKEFRQSNSEPSLFYKEKKLKGLGLVLLR